MGRARWILLARTTFSVFAAGLDIGTRPSFELTSDKFHLQFENQDAFKSYCQNVFRHDATRLVDFTIEDLTPHRVVCQMILNLTPKLRIRSTSQADPDFEGCDVVMCDVRRGRLTGGSRGITAEGPERAGPYNNRCWRRQRSL